MMQRRALAFAAVAAATPFMPGAVDAAMTAASHARFAEMCVSQMYMSSAQCGCMADLAAKRLDDLAVAYLSLDATDVKNSAAMSKAMTDAERSAIDRFMHTAPKACQSAAAAT